jgi:hypothetical protein
MSVLLLGVNIHGQVEQTTWRQTNSLVQPGLQGSLLPVVLPLLDLMSKYLQVVLTPV